MLAFQIGQKKMFNKPEQHIYKRIFNETSIESFRLRLRQNKLDNLKASNNSMLGYYEFLDTFTFLYDDCFPRWKWKWKLKNFRSWVTKDNPMSSNENENFTKNIWKTVTLKT